MDPTPTPDSDETVIGLNPAALPAHAGSSARGRIEDAGDRLGPYMLIERLGEGGTGVVWLAEQEEPVRRRGALKIIKLGMDTSDVIARFDQERQAQRDPADVQLQRGLAECHLHIGIVLSDDTGDLAGARRNLEKALEIGQLLTDSNPRRRPAGDGASQTGGGRTPGFEDPRRSIGSRGSSLPAEGEFFG